ncbi:MAG: hypothetical protein EP329_09890 [Deltaproteobacteria bacterium]|nr:MAG: hypothetical protein EP329_09890 [Deltaproteobacteria bacterium]
MNRRANIGFDRRIDLDWLDAAAAQAAAGAPNDDMRAYLWNLLDGVVSGDKSNSARGKTVTVLNHIWGEVPEPAAPLRVRAIAQLAGSEPDARIAIHWAMMVGTYPVFTDAAAAIGRLLTLQGSFTLAHLTRRLVGAWGGRSTLVRAGQRIVRSMVQWGVLRDTAIRGMYEAAPWRRKVGPAVGTLLLEALLVDAEDASVPIDQLTGHPAMFPFEVDVNSSHIRGMSQFRVHRQGLDTDFVELERGGL